MNRMAIALCVSASGLALALSVLALIHSGSSGAARQITDGVDLSELQRHVAALSQKIDALEASRSTQPTGTWASRKTKARGRATSEPRPTDVEGRIAALARRLASLEDEETIARLAQSGEDQLKERELRSALARIEDPESSPEARLEALRSLRRLSKTYGAVVKHAIAESGLGERDLILPLLEIAQDTSLEPEFRAEVVRSLESKMPELRQPLLDLLAFERAPEVREETVHALMYHLGDSDVRQALRQASQSDPDEAVRQRATKYLPKVEHFDRQAAARAAGKERPERPAKAPPAK